MKIAISGKGGVGKSTVAAAMALLLAEKGRKVLALDADPDANLAAALGIPAAEARAIIPVAEHAELIEERTGAKPNQFGQVFKVNPEVSDIAEKIGFNRNGVSLVVLGAVRRGGGGCACAESVLIRALVSDLVLFKDEALIMDMEAGVEHLGRATARGVDTMVVVVEPGQRAVDCALRVIRMAEEIGIRDLRFVVNKVTGPEDVAFVREALPDADIIGTIPFSDDIRRADRDGLSVAAGAGSELRETFAGILSNLEVRRP